MWKYLYPIIVISTILLGQRILVGLRRMSTVELYKVLYNQNNPGLFLSLLKNPRLKLLYKKSVLLQFQLDAFLMLGEHSSIITLFEELDHMYLTKIEKLELNQKKLSYYCGEGYNKEALQTLDEIEKIINKSKSKQLQSIILDNRLTYRIYIKHDVQLIPELINHLTSQSGVIKGITQYRIAKLYYYKGDEILARKYLNESRFNLIGTIWQPIVNWAIEDLAILKTK